MQSGLRAVIGICALAMLAGCVQSEAGRDSAEARPATAAKPAAEAKAEPKAEAKAEPKTASKPAICSATDKTPARFETVTQQVLVAPAVKDAAGKVVTPASYRSETQQRQIGERKSLRFETPCAAAMTPEVIANLQRALRARALYNGPVDGRMGKKLSQAIRSYQHSAHGLDSAILSMQAARSLGLIAYDRKDL